jgi:hypothetical protein
MLPDAASAIWSRGRVVTRSNANLHVHVGCVDEVVSPGCDDGC